MSFGCPREAPRALPTLRDNLAGMGRCPDVEEAAFVAEARALADLPPATAPEIAIAGRSNVGKSTLLNRLAARKALARTSKTPGRTRGLVMFALRFRRGRDG